MKNDETGYPNLWEDFQQSDLDDEPTIEDLLLHFEMEARSLIEEELFDEIAYKPSQFSEPEQSEQSEQSEQHISQSKKDYLPANEYFKQKNLKRIDGIEKNIPEELKSLNHWCAFKTYYDKEKGSKKKVIKDCNSGKWASILDKKTWSSFEHALKYARENNCEGLAFALTDSGITCIDLDKCISKDNKRSELAWDILNQSSKTYAEKSISGNGIHVLLKGNFMDGYKTNAPGLEVFDNKFISLTGNLLKNSLSEIKEPKAELIDFLQKSVGEKSKTEPNANFGVNTESDAELIARIRRSKKGQIFNQLYSGTDVCKNHSESDYTLLNILAFFTDCDSSQMSRIFRSSGLYRPSKGDAYVNLSITKAIDTLCKRPDRQNRNTCNYKGK